MSLHLDYAEISRQARKIVDANRARSIIDQVISDPESKQKVKYTRSTTGCLSCRSHKVKCDETVPACLRCVASQRKCEYPQPGESSTGKKRKSTSASTSRAGGQRSTSVRDDEDRALNSSNLNNDSEVEVEGSKRVRLAGTGSRTHSNSNFHEDHFPTTNAAMNASPKSMMVDDGSKVDPSPTDNSRLGGPSPMDIPNLTSTPDFSFLNDFIPFPHITPPSQPPQQTNPTSQNIFNTNTSPSTIFTNDLTRPQQSTQSQAGYDGLSSTANNVITPNARNSVSDSVSNQYQNQAQAQALQNTLPHFDNFSKSLLLNRRLVKVNNNGNNGGNVMQDEEGRRSFTPQMQVLHPRLQMVDTFLQAFTHDEVLFEFGPSHRHRNLSNNTLTAGVIDVLSNAFPSPIARTLFHHYCNTASKILITMGNIGPNPLLTLCTPVKLLDTNSAASAAIRMSMLSTAIAHFIHETNSTLKQSGMGVGQWERMKLKMKEMSNKFKKAALSNITLAASSEKSPDQVDSILAACTLLCIRDVISADPTWRDNLEFALNLITKKGGPQVMLQGAEYTFTRRYLLENLATHDVFASFITGKEPSMLGNYDSWWFDSVETSQTRWEWESVERSFGISRAMVDLVARIAVLDSQKRRLGLSLKGDSDEMWDVGQHFERESHCLLLELDIWGNSLNALPQHVRVTCGDYIYKYMAVVFILADILEQPTSTPRIVKSIDHILELISEASAMRMSVMLIWPLLIAGVFSLPTKRQKVVELFNALSDDYCEDLEVARELLDEQWRMVDSGKGKQPWDLIMKKLGKYVLLI
ncbi:uncharacterized protein I303_101810 [Kwoniella dejecticola CBS 10117]|uniref:Zn(2)-C6 fungal-type domain-containing protein n=1 Tax=Kwoniella dejecticola CBS 10117 TaxID=1296121 RepID=A0A1A6ACQ9_9TREE|nr:uncharacterized protein I303_02055 [Kwoniella dejecticola CBS 10117]OBR87841.1 hypothetical protein I303_02055 [Kwoniella dejecticola CBS 10117]